MQYFTVVLNAVLKYAGLISGIALVMQAVSNRPRLRISKSSVNRFIGGQDVYQSGEILIKPNPNEDVLCLKLFLDNFGKWPSCIRIWKLKICDKTFINFDSYPNDLWLPSENGYSEKVHNKDVFVPINTKNLYLSPFESSKVSIDFILSKNDIKASYGKLIIMYSTYRFWFSRPKKAVLKFKIPPESTYIK